MSPKLGIPVLPFTCSTDTSTIIACTDDTCHLTVQSPALTLFVCWTPVTPQYRHWHLILLVLRTPVTSQYRRWHLHCLYCEHLSVHSTDAGTYIAYTVNTCHFTVQTLAPTLLVLWTPVTSQYRRWHLHCLYCEHLSLHSTDAGTCIARTVNTCHFIVQTLAPTLLILRMPVTSLYLQWHHHSLYCGYVSLHSTNTGTIIACTEDTCPFTVPALTPPFLFRDIRNLNNSAHEFQMCLLYVI